MFHERLMLLCKEKKTTPTQLCKNFNISPTNGTYWKNGSLPHADTLIRIAEYFGVSVDYLLGRSDERGTGGPALSEEQKRWIDLAYSLPDDKLAAIYEMVIKMGG